MTVAPWVSNFPTGWQASGNSGTTWVGPPAPNPLNEVIGPTGTQRYRTQFTIPAGVTGSWTATVSGDIYSGAVNVPARLVYDGVDQGAVTPILGGGPIWSGPRTFTLPAVPGAHTVELWVGQSPNNGCCTAPVVTFDFTNASQFAVGSSLPCGCCPTGGDARCYRTAAGQPQRSAFPLLCGETLYWVDGATGLVVDPATFEPCVNETFVASAFTATGQFFGDGPDPAGENLCNVVPAPTGTTGFAAPASGCYDPTTGSPTMTWSSVSSVEFQYGNPPHASGGAGITFSSPDLGTVTWPLTGQLNPGAQVLSNALTAGRRVLLTYLSGPLGSSPSGSVRVTSANTVFFHQNSTDGSTAPIRVRLDILQP